ncbi:MAG TPA: NAD-dependent epimerase/dehydratase family protein [Candidatus Avalokitesvara rifleensis]|uniref:NAD-dependent epimerase/dehydratase family protein n=1 Tax=Candidatus Avalokitesvara rifleensis TaxID=3367620 RepID=UPI002712EB42|nr:GDP-mannose 4,6-dehydratase [Candidatus Brocadiales bacterium]
MASYLVTGGAGFIGSHVAEELVRRGETVRILDNFDSGTPGNISQFRQDVDLVEGDLQDLSILRKALDSIDYVLHLAAVRSVPRSVDDPLSTNKVNVQGTLNVLWGAKEVGVKRVVNASSSSVYGGGGKLPQVETQVPNPLSPYAVSKLAAENYCEVFSKIYDLETVSLRYFNVFGPRQDPKSQYAVVVPIFIDAGLNGRQVEIHGDGLQSRDFTYIANTVDATLLAAVTPGISGKVFNIACGKRYSVLDLLKTIEGLLGISIRYVHTKPRPGDARHTQGDISLASQLMGYKPKVSFEDGLRNTIEWFKNNT